MHIEIREQGRVCTKTNFVFENEKETLGSVRRMTATYRIEHSIQAAIKSRQRVSIIGFLATCKS